MSGADLKLPAFGARNQVMTPPLHRRGFLAAVSALAFAVPASTLAAAKDAYANSPFRKISDAEWKKRLPQNSYYVLRHEATEPPGTSALN